MDITGKIIQLLPLQSGESKNGSQWQKQDYILEFGDRFPKKLCFNLWGDKINQFNIKAGDEVTVSFDLESREFNGRWYTDVRAWNVVMKSGAAAQNNSGASAMPFDAPAAGSDPFALSENAVDEDLPF